tara:strand:- start:2695 stop:4077 length:1383 start_codon:yes stop_codon:yes gene_type:complete
MTNSAICIVLFSVFTTFFAEAQQDTIIDNKPFAIHVVQSRETLYSISRQYNAELNDLVISNPAVLQGLKVGFKLLVPLNYNIVKSNGNIISQSTKSVSSDTLSKKNKIISDFHISNLPSYEHDTTKIKVALLLPFYLDFNDSLAINNKNIIYPKSKVAIDFYFGFQLAIDSINKLGYEIDLMVLDIPNDSVFTNILESNILYDREYIFGPIFIRQFEKLAGFYGFDKNKKLISPLSYMSVKNNYRNVYQTVPISIAQIDAMINFLVKSFNYEELIIIGQQKEDSLISYAKKKLSFQYKKGKCTIYTFENSQSIDRNFIKSKLKKDENFILIPSNDRSFVSRLLPTLASMEDTLFTIFGLNTWNRFDNLDYNDLVNLNVHLPSIFNNDDTTFYLEFLLNYYQKYFAYPQKYAYSAYQQCLYFLSDEFSKLLDFKTFPNTSFNSNLKFNIINYNNFERIIVK